MLCQTIIVYLTGKPGVGKYSIAQELASIYGFVICDNQLINNPIFSLLQYDGCTKIPDFAWQKIRRIREEIFDFLANTPENSYVLTNYLADNKHNRALYEQVKQMAATRKSLFVPVQLQISKQEHLRRLTQITRKARWKSIDPQNAEDNGPLIAIAHHNLLALNISDLTAKEAAVIINDHIKQLDPSPSG